MADILDVMYLQKADVELIRSQYPASVIVNQGHSENGIQRYKVTIPDEDPCDDSYYYFLFDNLIAMCSTNFQSRLVQDKRFRERIKTRAEVMLCRMGFTDSPM
jgi:hypothetical protein